MSTPNSYFVPGYGISRAVIQNEIRYHCGPDAIVRPYTFQVRISQMSDDRLSSGTNQRTGPGWFPHLDNWTTVDKGQYH